MRNKWFVVGILVCAWLITLVYVLIKQNNSNTVQVSQGQHLIAPKNTPASALYGQDEFFPFDYMYPDDWPSQVLFPEGCSLINSSSIVKHPSSSANAIYNSIYVVWGLVDLSPDSLYSFFDSQQDDATTTNSTADDELAYQMERIILSEDYQYLVNYTVHKDPWWPGKACFTMRVICMKRETE